MLIWLQQVVLLGSLLLQVASCLPRIAQTAQFPFTFSSNSVELKVAPATADQPISAIDEEFPVSRSNSFVDHQVNNSALLLNLHETYVIWVRIKHQVFSLAVDTASSDTWIADSYFNCMDAYGFAYPQAHCALGLTFLPETSNCGSPRIANKHFNVQHADGTGASGPMAIVPLQLTKNLTIYQQIGIASNVMSSAGGNNITSGILGLAQSSLTNMFNGTDVWGTQNCLKRISRKLRDGNNDEEEELGTSETTASSCNRRTYTSLADNLFPNGNDRNMTAPRFSNSTLPTTPQRIFALALSRDVSSTFRGGQITFGGIPDTLLPTVNATAPFVVVPNESNAPNTDSGKASSTTSKSGSSFYVILVGGVTLPMSGMNDSVSNDTIEAGSVSSQISSTPANRRRNAIKGRSHGAQKSTWGYQGRYSILESVMNTADSTFHGPQRRSASSSDILMSVSLPPESQKFVLDSTSPLSYLPPSLSNVYNSMFNPPAVKKYHYLAGDVGHAGNGNFGARQYWTLNCSTLTYIPSLGLQIGRETFFHNTQDLIWRTKALRPNGEKEDICLSAIQDGDGEEIARIMNSRLRIYNFAENSAEKREEGQTGVESESTKSEELYVLGQPFLKNVLAVFDIGRSRIGLASRVEYQS